MNAKYVPNVENCRRLAEVMVAKGIKWETECHWCLEGPLSKRVWILRFGKCRPDKDDVPAPLTDEMMEILPLYSTVEKMADGYVATYDSRELSSGHELANTPTNALCLLLIWIEQGGRIKQEEKEIREERWPRRTD